MARGRSTKTAGTGRGSPEAIEKRKAARLLNAFFSGAGAGTPKLDGRTLKRRGRLLRELKDGRGGKTLKALEILTHANELLEMGETLSTIRKSGVKRPKVEVDKGGMGLVLRTQAAYSFHPDAWKLLGIDVGGAKRGANAKAKAKAK